MKGIELKMHQFSLNVSKSLERLVAWIGSLVDYDHEEWDANYKAVKGWDLVPGTTDEKET